MGFGSLRTQEGQFGLLDWMYASVFSTDVRSGPPYIHSATNPWTYARPHGRTLLYGILFS